MPTTPISLPERLYLLGYDPQRKRFTGSGERGCLLRAAALTELLAAGALRDEGGKAVAVPRATPPADPLLAQVLEEVAGDTRPRSWQHWVRRRARHAPGLVRDRLAAARWLRVEPHRVLGIFPGHSVTVRDTRAVRRLADSARAALHGTRPEEVAEADAAAVALAAAARLRTVVSRADGKRRRDRIDALTARTGPVPKVLRKVVDASRAATVAASSGGG
ncbi:GPP34 family phosphoprotein [Pseudonocardia yuanmonensis]|uniref:GPP34 family phosphoprotein n=1 Tax=Pseudonocardia yuanmonensis TaxID=1095914 RepID=A0ABP8VZH0_9PSEU